MKSRKRPVRRQKGNRGKDLESVIDLVHYRYKSGNVAYPIRNHPEIRIQSRGVRGQITGYLKARAEPDYLLIGGGHVFLFDAKRVNEKYFKLDRVHAHQATALTAASNSGAFSFLLIQTPDGRFVVPWLAIADKFNRWKRKDFKRGTGATRLSAEELDDLAIVRFGRHELPDYFKPVCEHLSVPF